MPVGGVQSQNPTQGLVHWMSAVMAEHMTSNSHHDPTVGMHYMWNGGVDVSKPSFFLLLRFILTSNKIRQLNKQCNTVGQGMKMNSTYEVHLLTTIEEI